MAEEHTDHGETPTGLNSWLNRGLLLCGLGLLAFLVPWLLQDPNYRDLARLPMKIDSVSGVTVRKIHGLISRQERHDSKEVRYLVQFTFEVKNERRTRVDGLRVRFRGIGTDDRTMFTVRARPPVLDLAPGETTKVFVRARDLQPETVDQLARLVVAARSVRASAPR